MVTVNDCKTYLEKFDYQPTEQALEKILARWEEAKGNLLTHFRKSPFWSEENLAIVLNPTEYELEYSQKAVAEFRDWLGENVERLYYLPNSKELINPNLKKEHYQNLIQYIESAMVMQNVINEETSEQNDFNISFSREAVEEKITQINAEVEEFNKYAKIYDDDGNERYVPREIYDKTQNALRAIAYMRDYCNNYVISDEQARKINEYIDIHANEGQKVSKVIGKICREVGIDTIKDMKTVTSRHVDSATGEEVETQREYDDGYNRKYQFLADGTSPKTLKQITVISLNPMDFWGMSIMHKASSCHTIDIHNVRNLPNSHHGMYSNGTMSYMFDPSTVIFYTLDVDKEGNVYYNEDKMRRCVFGINENGSLIMQARVYPDGRDNGDKGLAKQFRGKVQLIVSQCWNVENKWILKKGSSECRNYTTTESSIHYPDYVQYEDGSISANKVIKDKRPLIRIGSVPTCIRCGEENEAKDNIVCSCCRRGELRGFLLNPRPLASQQEEAIEEAVAEEVTNENTENQIVCAHCGEVIENVDEAIEIDGEYFCNNECAEEEGYRFCIDDDEWHDEDEVYFCEDDGEYHTEDNCYLDAHNNCWYSGDPEIETTDGTFFSSEENANAEGYYTEYFTDEFMHEDEMIYDDYENVYFDPNNDAIRTRDGEYFATEDSARNSGYEQEYFTDDWVNREDLEFDSHEEVYFDASDEDAIHTEDDNCYATEASAKANGYRNDYYSGRWYSEDYLVYDENRNVFFDPNNSQAIHTNDGNVFVSRSSAETSGYTEIDGEWMTEEEAETIREDNEEYEVGA